MKWSIIALIDMKIPNRRVWPLNVINTKPVPAHTQMFCTRKLMLILSWWWHWRDCDKERTRHYQYTSCCYVHC